MASETQSWTFSVPESASLALSNVRGSTVVRAGQPGTITVTAVKRKHAGVANQTEIHVNQEPGGQVRVETRSALPGFLRWFYHPAAVDYTVEVPQGTRVKLEGVSNSVVVEGLHGSFAVTSVSGPVRLADLHGPLEFHAVSGDVTGEKLTGSLILETVSGNVRLSASHLSRINGSTVSGDVWLETPLDGEPGKYHFSSVSGNVVFRLPDRAGCEVAYHSLSGRVHSNLPIEWSGHNHGGRHARINGGGPRLSFNSVSGDIWFKSASDAPDVSDVASSHYGADADAATVSEHAGAAEVSHMDILQKIEAGELTVEQGLNLLA